MWHDTHVSSIMRLLKLARNTKVYFKMLKVMAHNSLITAKKLHQFRYFNGYFLIFIVTTVFGVTKRINAYLIELHLKSYAVLSMQESIKVKSNGSKRKKSPWLLPHLKAFDFEENLCYKILASRCSIFMVMSPPQCLVFKECVKSWGGWGDILSWLVYLSLLFL